MTGSLRAAAAAAALTMAVLAGCSDGTGPGPNVAALQPVSGDQQLAVVVGTEAPLPLVVKAVDASGSPLAGKTILFRVVAGGGSLSAPSAVTDAQGQASVRWTVGTVAADSQRVEAQAGSSGPTLVFRAVARSGNSSTVAYVAGNGQTGPAGSVLPESLAVIVRDAYGNPVEAAVVRWATSSGGSLSPTDAQTGADGIARSAWKLGPATGAQSAIVYTSQGTISFQATATAPPPPPGSAPVAMTDTVVLDLSGSEPRMVARGSVSWNAGQNPGVWVEWGTSPTLAGATETPHVQITRTDVNSVTVGVPFKTYTAGDTTRYYARVAAANAFGVSRGAIKSFQLEPPPGPVNFRARFDASRDVVILEWDNEGGVGAIEAQQHASPSDTSWYNILQGEGGAPPYSITGTSAEDRTFNVKVATAGAYRARGRCNPAGCGPTVTIPAIAIVPLAPPTGLTAVAGGGKVALAWMDNANNEYQYLVFRNGAQYAVLPANTTTYNDFGILAGNTYTYTVAARAVFLPLAPDAPNSPVNGEFRTSERSNAATVTP